MIHPDIKAFWESRGYELGESYGASQAKGSFTIWDLRKDGCLITSVGLEYQRDKQKIYYIDIDNVFNRIQYSEDEMLKLIKLKAFI